MSEAEILAEEFERGERDVELTGTGKNRTKSEIVGNKYRDANGDTRRMMNNWLNGEENRKEKEGRPHARSNIGTGTTHRPLEPTRP
ncbi:hypothetical protein AAVH_40524 [Aphelenchoides avenae]|nr:hypothetical protein AAVH_40524 [Aphelenchus avenae]